MNDDATSQRQASDEFLKAFAFAVLMWQLVEDALFSLLLELSASKDKELVGEIYYDARSFGKKLETVNIAAVLAGKHLSEWNRLRGELSRASQEPVRASEC